MDVIKRITELTSERGWSTYRLAQKSGLSASTIANIYRRNTVPSLSTLEALCDAFGITLSQFFSKDTAVSYTHLDVYKRQNEARGRGFSIGKMEP